MYSVVMLAAMTAAPEAPDFCCCKGGCSYVASCYGCGGCYGGCYGYAGGYGYGYAYGYAPVYPAWQQPAVGVKQERMIIELAPPPPMKKEEPKKKDPKKEASLPSDKAQIVVNLPADAKLIAEGQLTAGAGAERVFLSPSLPEGQDFHYTLKIEYQEGNEIKTSTAKLTVRGGHRSEVDFNIHSKSAVTVNLPENAKLFVDGAEAATKGGLLAFTTPELPRGQTFAYQFRAEIVREGKTETVNREVKFKAGEPVVVNFNEMTGTSTASK